MDRAGLVNGHIYTFNDYQWLHGIFVAISTPIIGILLTCHTYKFCMNYHARKVNNKVASMTKESSKTGPSSPSAQSHELSVQSKSKSNSSQQHRKLEFPQKKGNLGEAYYYIWMMHILVFVSLVFGFLDCIFSIISYFHLNIFNIISHNCQLLTTLIVSCWTFTKNSLAFIALLRILAGFKNSTFEYKPLIRNTFLIYFILVTVFGIVAVFLLGKGTTIYNDEKEYYWCQYSLSFYFVAVVGVLDIGSNIILLSMFIRPLLKLSKMSAHSDTRIIGLVVKYFILVISGIMSTSGFYICLMIGLGSAQILDAAINLTCVLLMSPLHTLYYKKLCKICNNKLFNICTNKINKNTNNSSPV